jgi:hypothetical protein
MIMMMMKITWWLRIPCEEDKEDKKQDDKDDSRTTIQILVTS